MDKIRKRDYILNNIIVSVLNFLVVVTVLWLYRRRIKRFTEVGSVIMPTT